MGRAAARRRVSAVLVAVLVLLTAACGGGGDDDDGVSTDTGASTTTTGATSSDEGGDDPAAEEAKGDLCRLVTKAEADAVTGKDVGVGTATSSESPVGEVGSCVYKIVDGGRATTIVNVTIVGTEVPRDLYDAEMAGGTAVTGVGTAASLVQPGILSVFDDGVALSVQVLVDLAPATTDDLVEVAKKALERV